MKGLNKALQAMPATVAFFMVLHPRGSTLPLVVWFLLVVAYEAIHLIQRPRAAVRMPVPPAFQWFATGSILFYVLMALGLGWTENEGAGWFALEVKFSLLLVPLLMMHHWRRQGNLGLSYVPIALASGLVIFMGCRLMLAGVSGDSQLWRYDGLAGPFHPTYMGLYLVLMPTLLPWNSRWCWMILALTGLFVGLLASKAAWIVAVLLWGSTAVFNSFLRGIRSWGIAAALTGMCLGVWFGDGGRWSEFAHYVSAEVVSIEQPNTERAMRTSHAEPSQPEKVGSSAGRMQAWSASLDILLDSPFGVGTGDVTDALCEVYREKGSTYALDKRMNPHSAWLQLAVSHGWIGLVLTLLWWSGLVFSAYWFQNTLLFMWSVAWALNGTIESLLELQQGVVPTVLLCCVFALRGSPDMESGRP